MSESTSTGKETLRQIIEGLEGVTPGTWGLCHHLRSPEHDASCSCGYRGGIWSGDGEYLVVEMGSSPDVDSGGQVQGHTIPQADRPTQLKDAAHIARCHPDAIRAIAAYVAALERSYAEVQEEANELVVRQYEVSAQAAEIARLREALEQLVSNAERHSLDRGLITGRLYDAAEAIVRCTAIINQRLAAVGALKSRDEA